MRIVMAGSSGFLGGHLRERLAADGHELVQLVRRPPSNSDQREWHPERGELDPDVLAGADVVVNLAGAGVEDKRWTDAYRKVLVDSRVQPSATLATTMAGLAAQKRPALLLNASAVGYYGDTGDKAVDEDSPGGHDFFGRLCEAWEGATKPASDAGVRVVHLRTGLVLDREAGLLKPLLLPFRLGMGGPLAGGRFWMPWITLADFVSAVVFLMERDDISGGVNVVGPQPVRNADFVKALGRVLHRPAIAPVPRIALRMMLGDFADEGALANQRVLPGVLNRAGFTFAHPDLDSALRAALHQPARNQPAQR